MVSSRSGASATVVVTSARTTLLVFHEPVAKGRQKLGENDQPVALGEQRQQLAYDIQQCGLTRNLGDRRVLARRGHGGIQQHFLQRLVLFEQVDDRDELGFDLRQIDVLFERDIEQGPGVSIGGGSIRHASQLREYWTACAEFHKRARRPFSVPDCSARRRRVGVDRFS